MWTMETNTGNSFDMGERSGNGGSANSQRDETAAVGRTKNCTYSTRYHDQWRWLRLGTVHGTNNRPQHLHTTYFAVRTVRTFLELIPRMCSCWCRMNLKCYSWSHLMPNKTVFRFSLFSILFTWDSFERGVFRLHAFILKSRLDLFWAVFCFWLLDCVCVFFLCASLVSVWLSVYPIGSIDLIINTFLQLNWFEL